MIEVGLIYKITNIKNNKLYIGQTVYDANYRIKKHYRDAFNINNREYNTKFNRAIRKHGKDCWHIEIIHNNIPVKYLNEMEKFYIFLFNSFKTGYNSTVGGEGVRGFRHKHESKRKISKSLKGRTHTEESKKKMSIAQKGKIVSEETKKKIGISSVGRKSPRFYGRKHSEVSKQKISRSSRGRKLGAGAIEKRSQTITGVKRQGTSIYVGVCLIRSTGKWRAKFQGKYLGVYDTEKKAALAYNKEALLKYKDKAKLNIFGKGSE